MSCSSAAMKDSPFVVGCNRSARAPARQALSDAVAQNRLSLRKDDSNAGRESLTAMDSIIGSSLDTSAHEGNYTGTSAYVLENEHLRVYLRKIGTIDSHVSYDTRDLLLAIYQKDTDQWLPLESIEISMDNDPSSESGAGYTILERSGDFLPYGRVNAHMNSAWGRYYVNITLESGADFIQIESIT